MLKNNCVLDFKNEISIPQNSKTNFLITKSLNWNYCIDIKFNLNQKINNLNLFLIVQSYAQNLIYFPISFAVVIEKKSDPLLIIEKINIHKIRLMSFEDFEEWVNYRLAYDWKYVENEDFYCFRFIFHSKAIDGFNIEFNTEILNFLKPNYPWDKSILIRLKPHDLDLISETKILKYKIKKLKKLLKLKNNKMFFKEFKK